MDKNTPKLKVWTCTTFRGTYIGGATSAVAIAETPEEAAAILRKELIFNGLLGNVQPDDMIEVPTNRKHAVILNSGS